MYMKRNYLIPFNTYFMLSKEFHFYASIFDLPKAIRTHLLTDLLVKIVNSVTLASIKGFALAISVKQAVRSV